MKGKPVNLQASVTARLRNIARDKGINFEFVLRRYAIERLLYRLSLSPYRDRFVLKGAMLFTAWIEDPFRPTRDVDLLGFGDSDPSAIGKAFRDICGQAVDDDALRLDGGSLQAEPIRDGQEYPGVRVCLTAFLGKMRIPVQVDIGFGDAITPAAVELEFPPLLDAAPPRLLSYPKETVVAEKFEAIVDLGEANSRMKDYYDLVALSRLFAFDGLTLSRAIAATFQRRETEIPAERPVGLSTAFAADRRANLFSFQPATWRRPWRRLRRSSCPLHALPGQMANSAGCGRLGDCGGAMVEQGVEDRSGYDDQA